MCYIIFLKPYTCGLYSIATYILCLIYVAIEYQYVQLLSSIVQSMVDLRSTPLVELL